jgi:hypothetical protein
MEQSPCWEAHRFQLVKKFLCHWTRSFITAFSSSRHPSLSNSKLQNPKWVNISLYTTYSLYSTVIQCAIQIHKLPTFIRTYSRSVIDLCIVYTRSERETSLPHIIYDVTAITVASKIESHYLCNLRISKRNKNVLVVEDYRPSSSTVFRRSEYKNK